MTTAPLLTACKGSTLAAMPGLSEVEVQTFLDEPGHLLRLATVDAHGFPRVVPIWFIFEDDRIWFTPRLKSAWWQDLQHDRRVALTIDEDESPYRKVALRSEVTIEFEPGQDDEWRDLYRAIAKRYTADEFAQAYVNATIEEPRALLSVPCDVAGVTTWRMPVAGEDPAGVWADRYYHRKPDISEWVP